MLVYAVGKQIPPFKMPARFRTDVAYFITPFGDEGVPSLGPDEYWIRLADARQWLNDLVVQVVSPLSAEAKADLELTEDQEAWLAWLVENQIEHVRLER